MIEASGHVGAPRLPNVVNHLLDLLPLLITAEESISHDSRHEARIEATPARTINDSILERFSPASPR